ncbi:MAG: lytic transglycosylase domain-containing protein [Ferruginibacter sp.]
MVFNILKKTSLFTIILLIGFTSRTKAQTIAADNSSLIQLSANINDSMITDNAAVVFPAILSGNENASTDYIEKFSKNRRNYLINTYKRGKSFFTKASAILKKYDLPAELNVLLALESGFNANAVSGAGAVGYWQLMDKTAKEYGLKIFQKPVAEKISRTKKGKKIKGASESFAKIKKMQAKDDRRNFNKSTCAAAQYLRDRSKNLNNDWLLVVASYNCGIGNVWDAMAQSGKDNPTFWDIKNLLPAETQGYVMNFIALNVIFNNYEKFANNTLAFRPLPNKTAGIETEADQTVTETSTASFK